VAVAVRHALRQVVRVHDDQRSNPGQVLRKHLRKVWPKLPAVKAVTKFIFS
jgi:hypothetical protein